MASMGSQPIMFQLSYTFISPCFTFYPLFHNFSLPHSIDPASWLQTRQPWLAIPVAYKTHLFLYDTSVLMSN